MKYFIAYLLVFSDCFTLQAMKQAISIEDFHFETQSGVVTIPSSIASQSPLLSPPSKRIALPSLEHSNSKDSLFVVPYTKQAMTLFTKLLEKSAQYQSQNYIPRHISYLLAVKHLEKLTIPDLIAITTISDAFGARTLFNAACIALNKNLEESSLKKLQSYLTIMKQLNPLIIEKLAITNRSLMSLLPLVNNQRKLPQKRKRNWFQKVLGFTSNNSLITWCHNYLYKWTPQSKRPHYAQYFSHKIIKFSSYQHWHAFATSHGIFSFDSNSQKIKKICSESAIKKLAVFHKSMIIIDKKNVLSLYSLQGNKHRFDWKEVKTHVVSNMKNFAATPKQQLIAITQGNHPFIKLIKLSSLEESTIPFKKEVHKLLFNALGTHLAILTKQGAYIIDVINNNKNKFPHEGILRASFTATNKLFVTSNEHDSVKVWNVKNGECVNCFFQDKPFSRILISPNGLIYTQADSFITSWNLYTGECLQKMHFNSGNTIKNSTISPNGRLLIITDSKNRSSLFSIPQLSTMPELYNVTLEQLALLNLMSSYKKNEQLYYLSKSSFFWKPYDTLPSSLKNLLPITLKRKNKTKNLPLL